MILAQIGLLNAIYINIHLILWLFPVVVSVCRSSARMFFGLLSAARWSSLSYVEAKKLLFRFIAIHFLFNLLHCIQRSWSKWFLNDRSNRCNTCLRIRLVVTQISKRICVRTAVDCVVGYPRSSCYNDTVVVSLSFPINMEMIRLRRHFCDGHYTKDVLEIFRSD